MVGAGYSFAHHFADHDPVDAMLSYRNQFKPSARDPLRFPPVLQSAPTATPRPIALRPPSISTVRRRRGEYLPLASPRKRRPILPAERGLMARNRARLFVGAKATLLERLAPMIAATKADEVMVTTMIYDHAARRRSYELLADAFGLVETK
jgi:alkanesulfonate monooxygenase SsuD/methylene tetrahydromethanopterin reductase-like flavin-dependent oxidoreductase (luciferase family)